MTTKYADRAFLTVGGIEIADLQSATLKQNKNSKAVNSMTRNGRNRGFVRGNLDIDITLTLAILNQLASPKLEAIDFESAEVSIGFVCGADIYTATGIFDKDTETSASGVGDEVKKTYNFGALDLVDGAGNSSLFDLQL